MGNWGQPHRGNGEESGHHWMAGGQSPITALCKCQLVLLALSPKVSDLPVNTVMGHLPLEASQAMSPSPSCWLLPEPHEWQAKITTQKGC